MTQLYHAATPSFVRHSHEPPPALGRLAGKKATWRDLVVRRPRVLASVFAVSFYAAFIARLSFSAGGRRYFVLFDDAMISMTYGRNLAHGHGLTWAAGQQHVAGYTNLLWTLWMGAVHVLPLGDTTLPLAIMLSSLCLLLIQLQVVGRIGDRLASGSGVGTMAVWMTALCYPLLFWALMGMEVGLVALLISGSVLVVLRWRDEGRPFDLWALAILAILCVLSRSDGVVLAAVIAAFAVLAAPKASRWRAAFVLGGATGATVLAQAAVQTHYYGAALPNTYYLKLAGIPLRARIERGMADLLGMALRQLHLALLLAGIALVALRSRRRFAAYLLAALFLAECVYSIYVGGDAYDGSEGASRFVVMALPCLLLLSAVGIDSLLRAPAHRQRTWLAVLMTLLIPVLFLRLADVRPGAGEQIGHGIDDGLTLRLLLPVAAIGALCLAWIAVRRLGVGAGGPILASQLGEGFARDRRRLWLAYLLVVVLLASVSGPEVLGWVRGRFGAAGFDRQMAMAGLALSRSTDDRASVATSAAGEISYFSHRRVVDLLGYSDAVVARERPRTSVFIPGHDKWDLAYSLGTFRPDVVAFIWPADTLEDLRLIESSGYQRVAHQVFVRAGSPHVDPFLLRRLLAGFGIT